MIEVTLETIQMSLINSNRIVVLKEVEEERYLAIPIGPCEAESIAICINNIEISRPLTHDLVIQLFDLFGTNLSYILISDLVKTTFHAQLVLGAGGEEYNIDSRSSDAIALAVRVDAPIYVAEHVMEAAGVVPEREVDFEKQEPNETLEVFRDYLDSLENENENQDT